jgi:hypothetical protein
MRLAGVTRQPFSAFRFIAGALDICACASGASGQHHHVARPPCPRRGRIRNASPASKLSCSTTQTPWVSSLNSAFSQPTDGGPLCLSQAHY